MDKKIFVFGVCIFSFIIFLSSVTVGAITGDVITGEIITGGATSDDIGFSLLVTGAPRLTIVIPVNGTYLHNELLSLSFTVGGEQAVWYNLDDEDNINITITSSTSFNTTEGGHTLYLFANNTAGNMISRNVTFFINLTVLTIIDDEYDKYDEYDEEEDDEDGGWTIRKIKQGESTDFFDYSYEQLENLSGVIFHNIDYGKILFNEIINLTNDKDPTDGIVNLNSNTDISSKRIEINSTALPNFNKSATLWFYNLSFSNPRILRDGSVCSVSICTQESYTGGALKTLKFNVTGFSVYTVEETPSGEETPSSSGGSSSGGGGGGIRNFSLDTEKIKVSLRQGETIKQEIIITNTGDLDLKGDIALKIEIEDPMLGDFIKISESNFELAKGESKTIVLDFIAREDTIPNLYLGKIIIRANGVEKEVLIAIEVESKKALFDVKVEVPEKFLYVMPGEEFISEIILYNLGKLGRVDVTIEYIIKDEDGNDIVVEQESLAVETQASFIKNFRLPLGITPGNYIFYVKIFYQGEVASASAWFFVVQQEDEFPFSVREKVFIIIMVVIVIIIIILLFMLYNLRKSKHTEGSKTLRKLLSEVKKLRRLHTHKKLKKH